MAVRKLKGSWWVDFQYRGERIRRRSPLNTKSGAQELELDLRQLVLRGGSAVPPAKVSESHDVPKTSTFATFAEQWFVEYAVTNNKPSEQRAKRNALRNHLIPFLQEKPLHEINNRLIEKLKGELRAKGLCHKSINNYLSVLHTCLATAVEWELLTTLPHIKPYKVSPPPFTYLSTEECDSLLAAMPPGVIRSMAIVALQTGARYCELIALRWEDIKFTTRQLRICRAEVRGHIGTTKSGHTRHVPLSDLALAVFESLPKESDLVFHRHGRSVRYVRALEALREACSCAGIPHASWHTLRHTFASTLVQRGVPLAIIRDLLGHATVKMTERYAHLNDTPGREAISLLDGDNVSASTWRQPAVLSPHQHVATTRCPPSILGSTKQKAPPLDGASCMVGVDGVEPPRADQ